MGNALLNPTESDGVTRLSTDRLIVLVLDEGGDGVFSGNIDGGLMSDQMIAIGSFLGGDDRVLGLGQTKVGAFPGDVVGSFDNVSFEDNQFTGNSFGVYFFDQLEANSTKITGATSYGFARADNWTLPDSGAPLFGGNVGSFDIVGGTAGFSVSPVPEPSALILYFVALAPLLRRSRRRP